MSNEGDKLLSEEIMEIHRFIGMFHKWLPDLAKIDTNLRFANVLPTVRALDPNATSATDFTTRVTAATLFKMLVAMGREEMRLRGILEAVRAMPVVNRDEMREVKIPSGKSYDEGYLEATRETLQAADAKYLGVIEKLVETFVKIQDAQNIIQANALATKALAEAAPLLKKETV